MGLSSKWLVLWSLWAARLVRQPTLPVQVSNGWVVGLVAPSGTHNQYLGVPYATVQERFQPPGPEPTWEGVFDAINENVRCLQILTLGSELSIGQEDCLILNVYTPLRTSNDPLLPVMVFIHGGGFFEGSSSQILYGPEYLIDKGVIFVAINYRVYIHGFLCLGIKEAPGNIALKDQVAALKWIQRNIKAYGGDPDNVTIFGESAGAASVSYHILSPMSKGLFHKAIMQSGSSISGWAHQFEPVHRASRFAKTMGYETEDPHKLYELFMEKSNYELTTTIVPRLEGTVLLNEMIFPPCVENKFDGVEPFLTETPYNVLRQGKFNKVPIMMGANGDEGLFFLGLQNEASVQQTKIDKSLALDLLFPTEDLRSEVAKTVHETYMNSEELAFENKKLLVNFSKYTGDMFFNYPPLEEASLIVQASDQPVYNYLFTYDGWRNIVKLSSKKIVSSSPGAVHADDLFYIFSQALIPSLFETEMIEKVTTLWTNFAKYGDPTPSETELLPVKWPPVDLQEPLALRIDSQLSVIPMWYSDHIKYWREIYSKYRRKGR